MMPLEVVGKISSVVSLSFRLFGNIFGGSIIIRLYQGLVHGYLLREIIGLITGINLLLVLFFVLFEGALQAFVFTVLTLTYLSIALQEEG
jgi:F-type H+-transporting ATPase subunit a